jgi:hypothetical protein
MAKPADQVASKYINGTKAGEEVMHDIVERLRFVWPLPLVPNREFMDEQRFEAADEIQRLRKANTRLAEIATDAVEWLPPASVNGPREKYQNEIKELTDGYC